MFSSINYVRYKFKKSMNSEKILQKQCLFVEFIRIPKKSIQSEVKSRGRTPVMLKNALLYYFYIQV